MIKKVTTEKGLAVLLVKTVMINGTPLIIFNKISNAETYVVFINPQKQHSGSFSPSKLSHVRYIRLDICMDSLYHNL